MKLSEHLLRIDEHAEACLRNVRRGQLLDFDGSVELLADRVAGIRGELREISDELGMGLFGGRSSRQEGFYCVTVTYPDDSRRVFGPCFQYEEAEELALELDGEGGLLSLMRKKEAGTLKPGDSPWIVEVLPFAVSGRAV